MYKVIAMAMLFALFMAPVIAQAMPSPPAITISDMGSVADRMLNNAAKEFFLAPAAITHIGELTYPGDTFEHTFNLANTGTVALPDSDASDGKVVHLYTTYRMTDQAGNKVQEGYNEITTSLAPSATTPLLISLPVATSTPSGMYSSIGVLFKIEQIWTRSTNTWTTGDAVKLDNRGVTFDVQTPTPPPTPSSSDILAKISNLFSQLLCWIKGLFGGTC